jgi:hypothetical protein
MYQFLRQATLLSHGVGKKVLDPTQSNMRLRAKAEKTEYEIDLGPKNGRPDAVRTPRFVKGA